MQVPAACMSSAEKHYKMTNAILLYGEGHGDSVFASVHDVNINREGVANIEAGTPVSKTGLLKMMKTLAPEDYAPAELLGNHIIAKGSNHLVWYCKPQKRQVWFKCEKLGEVSARTDHPGLVFIIGHGKWYVFAVKSRSRPTANTPLYVAPYFNVWKDGGICTGNIEAPKGAMRFSTEAWEEVYFRSYFTHPNIHEKGGQTKHRGGIYALWRSLLKGKQFPNDSLVDAKETLGQAFERTVKRGT